MQYRDTERLRNPTFHSRFLTVPAHRNDYLSKPLFTTGEKMTLRTSRSKYLICMAVIALGLTAAYPPVAASQETRSEADLSCSSTDGTLPCPPAAAKKE